MSTSELDSPRAGTIEDLLTLMRRLRDPNGGCPWDLQQTFTSIAPHTLEECYELIDCIERNDTAGLHEELGDLLFQVVFYAQLGEEQGWFDFAAVVDTLVAKLVRRHPHVFPEGRLYAVDKQPGAKHSEAQISEPRMSNKTGAAAGLPDSNSNVTDSDGVLRQWEAIKADERQGRALSSAMDDIPLNLPALSRAAKLQRRAARVGFDWDDIEPVWGKVSEELAELEVARQSGDAAAITDEMGDVLFACVNLARHLGVDPETALRGTGRKFERRFRYVEEHLQSAGEDSQAASLDVMDALWDAAKRAGL